MVVDGTFNIVVILKPTVNNVDLINSATAHEFTLGVGVSDKRNGVCTTLSQPTGQP